MAGGNPILAQDRHAVGPGEMRHPLGMDPQTLLAREAIRDLIARYNIDGDAGRFDDQIDLFTEDGWIEIPGPRRYEGRERLRELFTGAVGHGSSDSSPQRIAHHVSSLVIDLDAGEPTSATGACYYAVLTGTGLDHWGRYKDVYRLENERWRFASRRVSVDGRVPGGWADRNLAHL